ncbi:CBL-interacting protein kinase 7 [Apostasia shenzhenica]|uniref:non-specific serine/threonine protein kinase n=1 Tax=Apostasia shenzhenica TaxID=1088818 RepID=A0A2I0APB6_9ASPA|nr:CBL-interacting protein kinase 7 [Apostasia shenzhenica]
MANMKEKQPQPPPPPQVVLGKYQIGRLLGRGTFAKVYEARSLADGSAVAVKILDKPELVAGGLAHRILREVSAMRRLSDHPHILKLHEVLATRSKIFLVMELAPCGDLLSHVARRRRRRLPEPTASRYLHQLISALRFSHAHGVAHRDVKPQNLLLDHAGNLKVSDFGLSALPEHRREDGLLQTACGTPAYAAPEISRRKGYDGARADAWSCGVILFVLLAGFLPFDDSNLPEMYRRIHRRDYRFPSWFSPAAKRLISRLLDPNPETRITIDAVTELPWFRRANSLGDELSLLPARLDCSGVPCPLSISIPALNAFDIISLSAGLDLSRLFDDDATGRKERMFTTMAAAEAVVKRIQEVGGKLGYVFERTEEGGGAKGMGRCGAVMTVKVGEVAPAMLLVMMRVEGGRGKEEERPWGVCWEEMKAELGDLVFSWHRD